MTDNITTLIDTNLYKLANELASVRSAIKELKAKEDLLVEELKSKIGDTLDGGKVNVNHEDRFVLIPSYQLNMVQGTNTHIKRERLLERGVSPDVIDYATAKTTYTSLRIKENIEDNNV